MENINVSTPNDGLGDKIRDAFIKVNENFLLLQGVLDLDIQTQIDDILLELNNKSDINHTHIISQITGLQTALDNKVNLSDFNTSNSAINQAIIDINDTLNEILAGGGTGGGLTYNDFKAQSPLLFNLGTYSIQNATATQSGALTSTDWNTFNNKVGTSSIVNLVPYNGATSNVNLGTYSLSSDNVQFNLTTTATQSEGKLKWDDTNGTLEFGLKGGNVNSKVSQDLYARVVNKTSANLLRSDYRVVKISGSQGQRLGVALAQANNDANSADTFGFVCENISNNQEGFVQTVGQLTEINTSGSLFSETWNDADVLYLSPTTAGYITNVKPSGATGHIVVLGYVEYAHAVHGKIYIKIMNGWELEELHNVSDISYIGVTDSDSLLIKDDANSLWKRLTWSNLKSTLNTYFDTLYAQKASTTKVVINDTVESSGVFGTAFAEVIVKTYTIPANTFGPNDFLKFYLSVEKNLTNSGVVVEVKMSNTNTFVAGTTATSRVLRTVSQGVYTATIKYMGISRIFNKFNGAGSLNVPVLSLATDQAGSTNAQGQLVPLDPTQTIYVWITLTNFSALDTSKLTSFSLTN